MADLIISGSLLLISVFIEGFLWLGIIWKDVPEPLILVSVIFIGAIFVLPGKFLYKSMQKGFNNPRLILIRNITYIALTGAVPVFYIMVALPELTFGPLLALLIALPIFLIILGWRMFHRGLDSVKSNGKLFGLNTGAIFKIKNKPKKLDVVLSGIALLVLPVAGFFAGTNDALAIPLLFIALAYVIFESVRFALPLLGGAVGIATSFAIIVPAMTKSSYGFDDDFIGMIILFAATGLIVSLVSAFIKIKKQIV